MPEIDILEHVQAGIAAGIYRRSALRRAQRNQTFTAYATNTDAMPEDIATLPLAPQVDPQVSVVIPAVRSRPLALDDGRYFTPSPAYPRTVRGQAARLIAAAPGPHPHTQPKASPAQVLFRQPEHVQLCIRRWTRKRVILAAGHGGAGHKPPRIRETTSTWC